MEFVSAGKRAAITGAGDQMVDGFLFLHAKLGDGIAFGLIDVNSWIVVDLVLGVAADFGYGLDIVHGGTIGGLKVVVGEGVLAGAELLLGAPTFYNIFLQKGAAGGVVEAHFVLDWAILVHLRLVRKDELVGIFAVLEEIEDAAFFHQAGDKVESRFAVLHNVFAFWIAAVVGVISKI